MEFGIVSGVSGSLIPEEAFQVSSKEAINKNDIFSTFGVPVKLNCLCECETLNVAFFLGI